MNKNINNLLKDDGNLNQLQKLLDDSKLIKKEANGLNEDSKDIYNKIDREQKKNCWYVFLYVIFMFL